MRGVVTCPDRLAASAGAEILAAGGNAVDAATATAFAQGVVGPKLSGIGGVGVLTIFNAHNRISECIRFWGVAGSKAHSDLFMNETVSDGQGNLLSVREYRNSVGYLSILVPGFVRGVHEAFIRYGSGRVTWKALLEPAIRLARDGFEVDDYLYQFFRADTPVEDAPPPYLTLTATPACAAIYTRNNDVYHPGELLVQKDYANTLTHISEEGPEVFYEGAVASEMASDMDRNGGLFTLEDLRRYRPLISEPVRGSYRGYQILSDPPPGSGALVIEMLNILESLNLVSLGWNTTEYVGVLSRVFHHVFDDRRRYIADPRFVEVPTGMLTSTQYAAKVRRDVLSNDDKVKDDTREFGHEGTTHVSVIDGHGNAAAITHTVCDGSGVVTPGLGFMYNNDMLSFDPTPGQRNSIIPGKSPVNGGAPTIVTKDGEVTLAIGSPAGARKVTAIVQTIVNIVDFGMDVQQAVAAERIHRELGPLMVEPTFPKPSIRDLERLGQEIKITSYTARIAAVSRSIETGRLTGATDPRGGKGMAIVE